MPGTVSSCFTSNDPLSHIENIGELSREELAVIAMRLFMRLVNGRERDVVEVIAQELGNEHRTLQQLFVKVMLDGLAKYGEAQQHTDARNERAVEYCKKLAKEDRWFPCI